MPETLGQRELRTSLRPRLTTWCVWLVVVATLWVLLQGIEPTIVRPGDPDRWVWLFLIWGTILVAVWPRARSRAIIIVGGILPVLSLGITLGIAATGQSGCTRICSWLFFDSAFFALVAPTLLLSSLVIQVAALLQGWAARAIWLPIGGLMLAAVAFGLFVALLPRT